MLLGSSVEGDVRACPLLDRPGRPAITDLIERAAGRSAKVAFLAFFAPLNWGAKRRAGSSR